MEQQPIARVVKREIQLAKLVESNRRSYRIIYARLRRLASFNMVIVRQVLSRVYMIIFVCFAILYILNMFLFLPGMFPNHIPNPEDKDAMAAIKKAVLEHGADLGIIFDTDVDRFV